MSQKGSLEDNDQEVRAFQNSPVRFENTKPSMNATFRSGRRSPGEHPFDYSARQHLNTYEDYDDEFQASASPRSKFAKRVLFNCGVIRKRNIRVPPL